jgi:hypothetical protein
MEVRIPHARLQESIFRSTTNPSTLLLCPIGNSNSPLAAL